ncbi:MAG: hypothetical protein SGI77_11300 [Pirellulaceae bacterium]|nr:hypothetical protein [Pirellulaceae bacterium]
MKKTLAVLVLLALNYSNSQAADTAALATPGKVIYESKLDTAPGDPWKTAKGKWEPVNGAMRGSELVADKHGAVTRLPNQLQDFVIEYEFKFEGARGTSLSINAVKDHMARINISPNSITIQRDDNDHEGPDKAVIFARFATDLKPGVWHKVRMEMVGDMLYGQVDDLKAWGASDLFKTPKTAPGFTVAGESVDFRNLVIREATLNPNWQSIKTSLPKPGEQVATLAAKANPKANPKASAKAAPKKK